MTHTLSTGTLAPPTGRGLRLQQELRGRARLALGRVMGHPLVRALALGEVMPVALAASDLLRQWAPQALLKLSSPAMATVLGPVWGPWQARPPVEAHQPAGIAATSGFDRRPALVRRQPARATVGSRRVHHVHAPGPTLS